MHPVAVAFPPVKQFSRQSPQTVPLGFVIILITFYVSICWGEGNSALDGQKARTGPGRPRRLVKFTEGSPPQDKKPCYPSSAIYPLDSEFALGGFATPGSSGGQGRSDGLERTLGPDCPEEGVSPPDSPKCPAGGVGPRETGLTGTAQSAW